MSDIDRAKLIVEAVLRHPSAARAQEAERLASGDPALAALVSALLARYEADPTTSQEASPRPVDHVSDRPPETIGSYRVLKRIGQGGMGDVYAAVRTDDVIRHRVAIKLVRRGLDGESRQRFEIERQVLTVLNHPNIARLFDAGVTADDRPYLVMELVEGMPLDEYCNSNKLHVSQRLELFRQVCSAVSYAHANLVVHRDIKPANILVTPSGQVKLLDFGIAKLINADWLSAAVYTGPEVILMTPEYASPEQARREPVTTASDVYSLGVVLYELLTGSRPYDFKSRIQEEIRRVICEEPPERPSTRITKIDTLHSRRDASTSTLDLTRRATDRAISPENYKRLLSGELETLLLHALKKEPARRYSSVDEFSGDVDRWLRNQPLVAVGDSAGYHLRKFMGRNRGKVATAAGFVLFLCIGLATTIMFWTRAEKAKLAALRDRDLAATALERATAAERMTATERDEAFKLIDGFMNRIIPEANQLGGSAELKRQITQIAKQYLDTLSMRALLTPVEKQRRYAATLAYAAALGGLGEAAGADYDNAASALDGLLVDLRKEQAAAPDDDNTKAVLVEALIISGDVRRGMDDTPAALSYYREAFGLARTARQASRNVAIAASSVAELLQRRRDGAKESFELAKYSLSIRRQLSDEFDVSTGHTKLAEWHLEVDRDYASALTEASAALTIRRKLCEHNPTDAWLRRALANSLLAIGVAHRELGNLASSTKTLRESHDIARQALAEACATNEPDPVRMEMRIRLDLLRTRFVAKDPDVLSEARNAKQELERLLVHFQGDPNLSEYFPISAELLGDATASAGDTASARAAWVEAQDRFKALLDREGGDDIVLIRAVQRLEDKFVAR